MKLYSFYSYIVMKLYSFTCIEWGYIGLHRAMQLYSCIVTCALCRVCIGITEKNIWGVYRGMIRTWKLVVDLRVIWANYGGIL